MPYRGQSTIAQLVFPQNCTLDFARIVSELETVLSRLRGDEVDIEWDCDDLVTFDIPGTRILLSWAEVAKRNPICCLTVSVGPGLEQRGEYDHSNHEILCSRLIERIQVRYEPVAVLWCSVDGGVDAEQVDTLVEELPDLVGDLPPVDTLVESLSRTDAFMATQYTEPRFEAMLDRAAANVKAPSQRRNLPLPGAMPDAETGNRAKARARSRPGISGFGVANDHPDLPPLMPEGDLQRLREALYPEERVEPPVEAPYSTQMRLAAHCLNATLILVYAPLGAAVMTYSVLKGENMRLSSRMMAVAGTVFALAHSPFGETMAAMAQGLV
ncbi:MAG: hypothetical protein ABI832_03065 [bacterium]